MAWNVVVHNGVLQPVDPGSPSSFLLSCPPGAYTTTRTANNASCVLLWHRHLARLAHSFHLLLQNPPHAFSHAGSSFSNSCFLADLVNPCMEAGLQRAMELRRDGQEFVVTMYLTRFANDKDVIVPDIYVHLSPFDGTGNVNPAHLAIMGQGRTRPTAKYSEWVRSRQALEQARPPNVTENLLSNDGNALLEGTITNFFVVKSRKPEAKGIQGSIQRMGPKHWKDLEIHTAPLGVVLPGVIRQLIIEICKEEGISIQEVAPLWSEHHLWKEAFVTNSVRLVQPVDSIQAALTSDSQGTWEHFRFEACGRKITQMLQKLVWEKALVESISTSSFLQGNA